jgi:hypothetical protein
MLTEDGLILFNLKVQCFQDVGLTEWDKVVRKQCPDNNDLANKKFQKVNLGLVEAVTR